jgi:hypothetical protein
MYESRQDLRFHEMHEPVVFRGYRGEWHPSYLPEFCNPSNAHLVKLFPRRRMYGTEKKEVHVQVSCGELAPFSRNTGMVPRWRCKQV